jgi:hypothetical protein
MRLQTNRLTRIAIRTGLKGRRSCTTLTLFALVAGSFELDVARTAALDAGLREWDWQ